MRLCPRCGKRHGYNSEQVADNVTDRTITLTVLSPEARLLRQIAQRIKEFKEEVVFIPNVEAVLVDYDNLLTEIEAAVNGEAGIELIEGENN